ncbi:MAG: dihydrolipoyl dehydrogenase [Clostridia bacterium]|nr:dihydrolipoyl dehydrogenase [Clostridia bacterium]
MYDLIVIGGGPAGYVGAIKAAQDGLVTALFEMDALGGTCLNRGCIPTKALLHYAELYASIGRFSEYGITVENASFDFSKMHEKKAQTVASLRSGIEQLLKANKVTVIRGRAELKDAHTVCCNGEVYEAKNILLASGSTPAIPPIEGAEYALTSDDLLERSDRFYPRLAIVGGGVIGVEMAQVYRALGSEVSVFEAMDRLLPMMDRELSQSLNMVLKKRGVLIHPAARVQRIVKNGDFLTLFYSEKGRDESIEADGVLICTGRRPNTAGLFADGLNIEFNGRAVAVDSKYQTSIRNVYAVGDINGIMPLAHAAEAQALAAVAYMQGKAPAIDPALVPSCVYTDPEIASVGMTADEAKAAQIPIRSGKYVMGSNAKTLIEGRERSFIKLIFHADSDKLLGAQLCCAHATDLISELTLAIANGLTSAELLKGLRPHPTFVEGITEAIEASHGQNIHSMPTRR